MVFVISFFIILSSAFFTLGITLPLIKFQTFYFFDETPSLLQIIMALTESKEYLLAVLVAGFSILFPCLKQLMVVVEAIDPEYSEQGTLFRIVPILSKWSTMDVLLVAITIAAAKFSGLASALSQVGLWFYAGSALVTIFTHLLIQKYKYDNSKADKPD